MSGNRGQCYRVMLSGYDSDIEQNKAIDMITRLGGLHVQDDEASQKYVPDCTHIVCKKPNRSEKYLCACAAGKWVLTPSFLEESFANDRWMPEENYEWDSTNCSQLPQYHIEAPKRWRKRRFVDGEGPPFVGWYVGLVMKDKLTSAYSRIVKAGGGEAVDITSWYHPNADRSDLKRSDIEALLTHVLVLPKFEALISRSSTQDVPYLRSEFLAWYLLKDPPPSLEEYSLFKDIPDGTPSEPEDAAKNGKKSKTDSNFRFSPSLLSQTSSGGVSQSGRKQGSRLKSLTPKPLPSSVFANSALVFSTPTRTSSKLLQSSTGRESPNISVQKSPSGNPLKYKIPGWSSPVLSITKHGMKLKSPNGKNQVPTISLGGPKRLGESSSLLSKKQGSADSDVKSSKRLFTEEFFIRNGNVIRKFASLKKHSQTAYGILEKLPLRSGLYEDSERYSAGKAKPFSREVLTDLEASLEVSYCYSNFLKEVLNRLSPRFYPPPVVLYIIMKVILLDADTKNLADNAFSVLMEIIKFHPSQAQDIKTEKLYHKAFSLVTAPDTNETSPLMATVDYMMSQNNQADWRFWCSRDPTLGTLWTFYSRVMNLAIQPFTRGLDVTQGRREFVEEQVYNASHLLSFLAELTVKDYYDVITRKAYPRHSPMIKCLIADLLWPTMTGLEPWFRRPSVNLADMITLYIKSAENCASLQQQAADSDAVSVNSDWSGASVVDPLDTALNVLRDVGRLVAVTSSWCIHCDVRDKERETRRTSSRTLENELVIALRGQLEKKPLNVIDIALRELPSRIRLKVMVSLIQQTSCDSLIRGAPTRDEELSLGMITGQLMQMIPTVPQDEQKAAGSDDDVILTKVGQKQGKVNLALGDDVNKKNRKGETPLHVACINGKSENVKTLLEQPGIDPNPKDHVGWTPLGEACLKGHIECVKALLKLPLKKTNERSTSELSKTDSEKNSLPLWEIDLRLSADGCTPLHDAMANNHLDIACMLIEKGGTELLELKDNKGKTPFDVCRSEDAKSYVMQQVRKASERARKRKLNSGSDIFALASDEEYEKALPEKSVLTSNDWRENVKRLIDITRLLITEYITSTSLDRACGEVKWKDDHESSKKSKRFDRERDSSFASSPGCNKSDLERYANDLVYCLKWNECLDAYNMHVRKLLGGDQEASAVLLGKQNYVTPRICLEKSSSESKLGS